MVVFTASDAVGLPQVDKLELAANAGMLTNNGIATQAQVDRVDRNHDELVSYKLGSSPAILTETLPF